MNDRRVVAAQIGRPSRAEISTLSRCHLDLPVVVQVPPLLEDGTPFPTLYWLTCPLAVRRISRVESGGGVKALDRRAKRVAEFGAALEAAHARYASQRDALLPENPRLQPSGGVAGATSGVKVPARPLRGHPGRQRQPGGRPGVPLGGTPRLPGPLRDRHREQLRPESLLDRTPVAQATSHGPPACDNRTGPG